MIDAKLARSLLHETVRHGGVFHLWGHAWELEAAQQWQRLADVLAMMGEFASSAHACTNGLLCQLARGSTVEAPDWTAQTGNIGVDGAERPAPTRPEGGLPNERKFKLDGDRPWQL